MAADTNHTIQAEASRIIKSKLDDPNTLIGILLAITVIIVTLILALWRRRRALRRSVLIMGLCEAGKSLIFTRLIHGKHVETHTSIKENIGNYIPGNRKAAVQLVDLPGHERVRTQFFDKLKSTTRAIIFVLDATTLQRDVKDVAEYIYNILADKVVIRSNLPISVACNKQDLALCKSAKVVQSLLEKEMNTLRVTRSAALNSISETGNDTVFLGKQGKDFEFGQIGSNQVDFIECSAGTREKECQLEDVKTWITKIA